jgi:predicted TIM-barrel fold metal-dependent hydrolase
MEELERFNRLALSAEEREKILWGNCAEFYGIE